MTIVCVWWGQCIHSHLSVSMAPHPQMVNIQKKVPESFKKQNLNLPHSGNYLYFIYKYLHDTYSVLVNLCF